MADDSEAPARQLARKQSGREESMAIAMFDERYGQTASRSKQASPKLFEDVPKQKATQVV